MKQIWGSHVVDIPNCYETTDQLICEFKLYCSSLEHLFLVKVDMDSTSGQDTPISSAKPLISNLCFLTIYRILNFPGQLVEGKPGRGDAVFFCGIHLPPPDQQFSDCSSSFCQWRWR